MDEQTTDNNTSLDQLKQQVTSEIKPLISQVKDPESRVFATMDLLRDEWDDALANEAITAAKSITDPQKRLLAFQQILGEISHRQRQQNTDY